MGTTPCMSVSMGFKAPVMRRFSSALAMSNESSCQPTRISLPCWL